MTAHPRKQTHSAAVSSQITDLTGIQCGDDAAAVADDDDDDAAAFAHAANSKAHSPLIQVPASQHRPRVSPIVQHPLFYHITARSYNMYLTLSYCLVYLFHHHPAASKLQPL